MRSSPRWFTEGRQRVRQRVRRIIAVEPGHVLLLVDLREFAPVGHVLVFQVGPVALTAGGPCCCRNAGPQRSGVGLVLPVPRSDHQLVGFPEVYGPPGTCPPVVHGVVERCRRCPPLVHGSTGWWQGTPDATPSISSRFYLLRNPRIWHPMPGSPVPCGPSGAQPPVPLVPCRRSPAAACPCTPPATKPPPAPWSPLWLGPRCGPGSAQSPILRARTRSSACSRGLSPRLVRFLA